MFVWFSAILLTGAQGLPAADSSGPTVSVVQPKRKTLTEELVLPANVEAYEQAEIFAKASGYVKEVKVDIGDAIRSGQVLARLDVPEMEKERVQLEAEKLKARAESGRLEALLRLQQLNHERAEKLFRDRAYTEAQLEQARAERDAAQAAIAVARADIELIQARIGRLQTLMDYATLRAPFAGTISMRAIDSGDFVRSAEGASGKPLFTLVRLDKLRVRMEVPESSVDRVKPETEAELRFRNLELPPQRVRVTRIASALRTDTRTMTAEIELANPENRVLPGMYALAHLQLRRQSAALLLPSAAVHSHNGGSAVWVVRDGALARQPVKLGFDDGAAVEVLEGVTEADQVVRAAAGAPEAGIKVRSQLEDW